MAEGFVQLHSFWSPEEASLAKLHLNSRGGEAELESVTQVTLLRANFEIFGVEIVPKSNGHGDGVCETRCSEDLAS